MGEIKFDEMTGKDVISQDGREVGKVDDLVLDHESWKVQALLIKLERELLEEFAMKRPMFGTQTVRLPVAFVSGVSDKVILQKKLDELTAHYKDKDVVPEEE